MTTQGWTGGLCDADGRLYLVEDVAPDVDLTGCCPVCGLRPVLREPSSETAAYAPVHRAGADGARARR